jgi:predicted Zn finger-like uncharacterized protein
MPEQIRCPECNATLRVPENLLGKKVKCPKCQVTFTAEMEAPAEPDEGIVHEPAPSASRRRPSPREEVEDEPPDEDEEEEDRPRRRRRRGRKGEALPLVAGPATALMIVGILDIILAILNLLLPILGVSLMAAGGGAKNAANNSDFMVNMASGVISGVLGLIMGPLITFGAVKMKQCNSYGLAMTASILAMIPFGNCCCLGLPFGIWALVVLNKPEVKNSFS